MTINRTFTDDGDEFAVTTDGTYDLTFLGGADRLLVSAGAVTAHMGSGNDRLRIDGGHGSFWGQSGDDRFNIYGSGNHVDAGSGNDTFEIGASNNVLSGRDGDDMFSFTRNAEQIVLQGGDGNDTFNGNSHSIGGAIYGGSGNDSFLMFGNHGGWTVTLRGGAGDDLYRLDAHSPARVIEAAGDGTDTIEVANGVTYTLGDNIENLVVSNFANVGDVTHLNGNDLANHITGGDGIDVIEGGNGNDVIRGGSEHDELFGGAGNDRIYGGAGGDYLEGGAGNDIFIYTAASDAPIDPTYGYSEGINGLEDGDRIDLSAIDANSELAGMQHFNIVQGSGHEAGTIYWDVESYWDYSYVVVRGYIDGDDQPDFSFAIGGPDGFVPHITNDTFIVG